MDAFATKTIFLGNQFGKIPFGVVEGTEPCMADAVQGEQPGLVREFQIKGHRLPYEVRKSFLSQGEFKVEVDGLSSMGYRIVDGKPSYAIDKTMFIHNTRTTISGLLAREIVVTKPYKSVFATGHHGFQYQYGVDLMAADALTEEEKQNLKDKGHRYLIFPDTLTNHGENELTVAVYNDDLSSKVIIGSISLESTMVKCPGSEEFEEGIGCNP